MKKFISAVIIIGLICAFSSCGKEDDSKEVVTVTNAKGESFEVVTENVTDKNGETVTDKSGEAVTQTVTVPYSKNETHRTTNSKTSEKSTSTLQKKPETSSTVNVSTTKSTSQEQTTIAEYSENTIDLTNKKLYKCNGAKFDGNKLIISEIGNYTLFGKLNGEVVVNMPENPAGKTDKAVREHVKLSLKNADITATGKNAITATGLGNVLTVSASKDTVNTITSNGSATDGYGIYSDTFTEIQGTGTLNISGNCNGINSEKEMDIKNISLNVNCDGKGIRSYTNVEIFYGAKLNINTVDDAIKGGSKIHFKPLTQGQIDLNYKESVIKAITKNGDAIDCDVSVKIESGIIFAKSENGYGVKNCKKGADKGVDFTVSNATVVAVGMYNAKPLSYNDLGKSLSGTNSLTLSNANQSLKFNTATENVKADSVLVMSNKFSQGTKYTIVKNGSISNGTEYFNGITINGTSKGGTEIGSLTVNRAINTANRTDY